MVQERSADDAEIRDGVVVTRTAVLEVTASA